MRTKDQSGFSHSLILLLVLVFALIGIVGWRVYSYQQDNKSSLTPTTQETVAPIESQSDLQAAQSRLDSTNIDGDLDTTSLDQEVEDLL